MKKRVMDGFRVLRELENLAEKAIDILNHSREIRSRSEASALRKSLQKILSEKEEKLEEILMKELVFVLAKVAEFLKDKKRSFKSKDFKKMGNEISDFLKQIESENGQKIKINKLGRLPMRK